MNTLTIEDLIDVTRTDTEPFELLVDGTEVTVNDVRQVHTLSGELVCVLSSRELDDALEFCRDRDLRAVCAEKGIIVADDNAGEGKPCWLLWFGAYGCTRVLAWGHPEDALEDAASALADRAPGIFATDSIYGEHNRCIAEYTAVYALTGCFTLAASDLTPDSEEVELWAHEEATVDTTYTESGYIPSWEWGYVFEDPTTEDIRSLGL